ncbi:bifunctional hydroxymethylpyrimidine kinase/phosphomethylpyrimidine kinase [Shewanella inventionis]|uniref:hydroxymethylpyrimidine kinase n=1 Tax=Shewanella inventionis TaxID=1738770 RepID=A0ABQ1IQU3_9GAMM|nr:bifunctional hydroxymethylpyrimidine kinase/phosphomethylpyrimidine kinase [Shewanella inventionis]MCL1157213.1 bifunctional hydroxymethylpyrimidine kinase/phosphomethylpyrimidine kinase [Shewanella inventionis]GGB48981.1 bifunctional hydroxy-(phospho)methylpyrimidine kinase/thiamine-phosphate pyrophosphorylase ThiDE [Shewanella inventionis]
MTSTILNKPHSSNPIVWSIAGSDSGGGAGIQADLLTMNDLGCHGCSVVTSITAQNSVSVDLVEPISAKMLLAQLATLWADLPPVAIKIGLLANQQQVDVITSWLSALKQQNLLPVVVLDPVMVASSGDVFNQIDFTPFSGLISVLTPNQHELFRLCSAVTITKPSPSHDDDEHNMVLAAQWLATAYQCQVVAKGGDAPWQGNKAMDVYVTKRVFGASPYHDNQVFTLTSPRVATVNHHGSGCTLSSAIASFSAHGFVVHDAVVLAKAYVTKGLQNSYVVGQGPGVLARTAWPTDLALMPHIGHYHQHNITHNKRAFAALSGPLGVYPVLDSLAQIKAVLSAGCKTVQFRRKLTDANDELAIEQLETDIKAAIHLARECNAQLFVNDHWQLALKHHAFGVHLGQEDLADANLTALAEAGMALGISSHSYFEALLAHQCSPSYIAFGHIYPTTTKQMPSKPQGIAKLSRYVSLLGRDYPTVAIGGIDKACLSDVAQSEVGDVAVVRAITQAAHPAQAYRELHHVWLQLTRRRHTCTPSALIKEAV